MKSIQDYHTNIFSAKKASEEGAVCIADIPDLETCSDFGSTPAEALVEVEIVETAWSKAARAQGKNIPHSQYRPIIYQLAA